MLTQASFPVLSELSIANTELTLLGLKKVFEMNAPKLRSLNILNNDIC
jgi:hypothetical protein